jgi:hypothetical protein
VLIFKKSLYFYTEKFRNKDYHFFCVRNVQHINKAKTKEHFMGEVKDARAITRIDVLCKTFQNKRLKEKGMHEEDMKNYVEEAAAKAKELLQDGEE